MNRVAIAIALILAGIIPTYLTMSSKVTRLEDELDRASATIYATERALGMEKEKKRLLDREYDALSEELSRALKKNQEWADTRVPDDVYNSLFPGTPR